MYQLDALVGAWRARILVFDKRLRHGGPARYGSTGGTRKFRLPAARPEAAIAGTS
jgi:hypothetical protein